MAAELVSQVIGGLAYSDSPDSLFDIAASPDVVASVGVFCVMVLGGVYPFIAETLAASHIKTIVEAVIDALIAALFGLCASKVFQLGFGWAFSSLYTAKGVSKRWLLYAPMLFNHSGIKSKKMSAVTVVFVLLTAALPNIFSNLLSAKAVYYLDWLPQGQVNHITIRTGMGTPGGTTYTSTGVGPSYLGKLNDVKVDHFSFVLRKNSMAAENTATTVVAPCMVTHRGEPRLDHVKGALASVVKVVRTPFQHADWRESKRVIDRSATYPGSSKDNQECYKSSQGNSALYPTGKQWMRFAGYGGVGLSIDNSHAASLWISINRYNWTCHMDFSIADGIEYKVKWVKDEATLFDGKISSGSNSWPLESCYTIWTALEDSALFLQNSILYGHDVNEFAKPEHQGKFCERVAQVMALRIVSSQHPLNGAQSIERFSNGSYKPLVYERRGYIGFRAWRNWQLAVGLLLLAPVWIALTVVMSCLQRSGFYAASRPKVVLPDLVGILAVSERSDHRYVTVPGAGMDNLLRGKKMMRDIGDDLKQCVSKVFHPTPSEHTFPRRRYLGREISEGQVIGVAKFECSPAFGMDRSAFVE